MIPRLLRRAPFRNFWLGQTISVFGDQVTTLAIPIVAVLSLNADPAEMGLLTAAGLLPHLLFSLPAGAWLDRVHRRRRVMILADVARAALIASIPLAFFQGWLSLGQLYIVTFLVGTLAVVFDISWMVVFVSVARREEFVTANSLFSGSRSLASVAGPSIGGVLIQLIGASLTMVIDALSYVASALFLTRVTATEPQVEELRPSLRDSLATGLSFILRDSIMRPMTASVATLNLFNFGFHALFVLYATTYLDVEPGALGLALGAGAVGGLLGAVLAARIGRRLGIGRAYAFGLTVFPAALIPIPLLTGDMEVILAMLFATEFVAGFGVMVLDVNAGAVFQARTPDSIRSRATGAVRTINYGVRPIGAVLGGLLASFVGVREALLVFTVGALLGLVWLIRTPILDMRDIPEVATGAPQR